MERGVVKLAFVKELLCLRCGHAHAPESKAYVCEQCGGKIEVKYDYDSIALSRTKLENRRPGVWKYTELLPVQNPKRAVTLGEGGTPLIKAEKLGRALGMKHLYLKDETRNPTASFKDRLMTVGVTKALEFGARTVVTASSGNAAVSLAAYAAKGGLQCYAFVPAGAPKSKLAQISIHGATVLKVRRKKKGDPTYELMVKSWERFGWHPIPSAGRFNPYHWEGIKSLAFEVCEDLGWKCPDWVFVPTGAGTLMSGTAKGFQEFEFLGLVNGSPRLVAVQAEGCAPLVRAFKRGTPYEQIDTWENPKTVAGGLIDPFPWDADTAIDGIKRSGGDAVEVSDRQILWAERELAKLEGVFAEPSGAAGIAGLKKLRDEGRIDPSDVVVVEVTGGGLKDIKTALALAKKPKVAKATPAAISKLVRI
jgi:threonine synthase